MFTDLKVESVRQGIERGEQPDSKFQFILRRTGIDAEKDLTLTNIPGFQIGGTQSRLSQNSSIFTASHCKFIFIPGVELELLKAVTPCIA